MRTGRRYKSYAGETGVSYQYFFEARRPVVRPEGQGEGADYTFVVTADQRPPFALKVFVSGRGLARWRESRGRDLEPNEQYASAKMRLFRAFDEEENLAEARLDLVVDDSNILELLSKLGVE